MWWLLATNLASGTGPPPIVGGSPAQGDDWEAVASLWTSFGFACTGTLITPQHVLTAAHCGYGLTEVRVGSTALDTGGEVRGVAAVALHDDPFLTLDVALVTLDAPVDTIAPAVLVGACAAAAYRDGAEVSILGFGATDARATEWPDVLQIATTTLRDADCSDTSLGCNDAVSPGGELVAGGDGTDTCSGDSGGPLFLGALLAGITSRAALPTTTLCGGGGIYVRADAVAPWLEQELGFPLPDPICDNAAPAAEVGPLRAAPGQTVMVRVSVTDADAGDGHVLRLSAPPDVGSAWVVDDTLVYAAPPTFLGDTRLALEVTDDGSPPLATVVEVPIHVRGAAGGPGGCHTRGTTGGWIALIATAPLVRRRRRGTSSARRPAT